MPSASQRRYSLARTRLWISRVGIEYSSTAPTRSTGTPICDRRRVRGWEGCRSRPRRPARSRCTSGCPRIRHFCQAGERRRARVGGVERLLEADQVVAVPLAVAAPVWLTDRMPARGEAGSDCERHDRFRVGRRPIRSAASSRSGEIAGPIASELGAHVEEVGRHVAHELRRAVRVSPRRRPGAGGSCSVRGPRARPRAAPGSARRSPELVRRGMTIARRSASSSKRSGMCSCRK